MQAACSGEITPQMRRVARDEGLTPEAVAEKVAAGRVVVPVNNRRDLSRPIGIGEGLRTKVNANVGTSTDSFSLPAELEKVTAALEAGADTIMDLSTGGDLTEIRTEILRACPVPLGTVPIYQAVVETIAEQGALIKMPPDRIFDVIERQAQEGVDFITVHCGVTWDTLDRLRGQGRLTDIVSRGGAFLVTWMVANEKENPLYEHYDRLLDLAENYDLTLSLGDGLRPGSLADATDRAQVQETIILGELTQRAWERSVQVMIEGPGHVPIDQVEANVLLEKKLCHGAPFYVLGPLVTDVASGYDHIACAIGGAIAAAAGADFLCYVTPGEHLRLPTVDEVREGVIAARIAAHAGDIGKGLPGALGWDREMSQARKQLDWEKQLTLSIDPRHARQVREQSKPQEDKACTMCGEYCAVKMVEEVLKAPRNSGGRTGGAPGGLHRSKKTGPETGQSSKQSKP
jgi:phosphomethylpyrimidine synthase